MKKKARFGASGQTNNSLKLDTLKHNDVLADELDQAIHEDLGMQQYNLQQSQVDIFEHSDRFGSFLDQGDEVQPSSKYQI